MSSISLPSILLEDFTKEILSEVVRIYAEIAEIQIPSRVNIAPGSEIEVFLKEIKNNRLCERRLGSSMNRNSKLFVQHVYKENCLHVAFDFDPNSSDDSKLWATTMRKKFHEELHKYLGLLLLKVK